jgi:LPXTG-site transpeptidase (sortase) family protein
MKLTAPKVLALTFLVAGHVLLPTLSGAVPSAHAVGNGWSAYQSVAPARLADTRPSEAAYGGFTQVSDHVIRVQVAGRSGVPDDAMAAVLNVTGVNTTAPGYVTVYPAGSGLPTASNVNFDRAGQVLANMVTVKLGAGGAVDIYMQEKMDVVVDVSGAYRPSLEARAGRLVTLPKGAFRALDTRTSGAPVLPGTVAQVDVGAAGVPADAVAVVVNLTATETGLGYWTAFPLGLTPPNASNLNIDTPGQTRAGQAIVLLSGVPAFNVFSQGGGHLVVDVAGYFTGSTAALDDDGLFFPVNPTRLLDSRAISFMPAWGGTTFEFSTLGTASQISAVAINITGTQSMIGGFVTAFPSGVARPTVSNLNFDTWDQTIANHAIVRTSSRGVSLFTLQGSHMIADLNGWYFGTPTPALLPAPKNPAYGPATAESVHVPPIGMALPVGTGPDLDGIANLGIAATWNGAAELAVPGNIVLFGHRTSHGAPFLNIDSVRLGATMALVGNDGHVYTYMVVRQDVTAPNYNTINNIGLRSGIATVQLVACTPPHSVRFRWVTTARLISVA